MLELGQEEIMGPEDRQIPFTVTVDLALTCPDCCGLVCTYSGEAGHHVDMEEG